MVNEIMDSVITEPYASLILWNHPMLILHKFLVRYNNIYFCSCHVCKVNILITWHSDASLYLYWTSFCCRTVTSLSSRIPCM